MRHVLTGFLTFLLLCFAGIHITVAAQDSMLRLQQEGRISAVAPVIAVRRDVFVIDLNGTAVEVLLRDLAADLDKMAFIREDSIVSINGEYFRDNLGRQRIIADDIYVFDRDTSPEELQMIAPTAGPFREPYRRPYRR